MNIGEFRHRIKLLKEERYKDEGGDWVIGIKEVASLWAKVTNIHGREFFAAATLHQERTLLFTIRYFPDVDEDMYIQFRGRNCDIKFIDNIKYRNEYLEIRALMQD